MSAATTVLFLVTAGLAACARPAPPPRAPRSEASLRAVAALQAGDFDAAGASAGEALRHERGDAQAAAVRAAVAYKNAISHLQREFLGVIETAGRATGFDHARMRAALERTHEALGAVDVDLAVAGQDEAFALPLCLACWERDWNHSGEIDEGDRLLFQIEVDAGGEPIPEGDPRRKPSFRFDLGDVYWARAMVSFQRDVGLMLSKPKDIVFDLVELGRLDGDEAGDVEQILASILGEYYVREGTPTGLIRRLARMRSEVERGEESLERKLRYLLWLN
jgi:hypothetical protein